MYILQLIGMWLLFLVTAIFNGWLRESILENYLSQLAAHQLSTLLFATAIFLITAVFIKYKGIKKNKDLLTIGAFWVCLTMSFEFLFFHYVSGIAWEVLLADYNILKGRLFSLIILTTLFSPLLTSKLFVKQH